MQRFIRPLLSVRDVALILGRPVSSIYELVKSRKLAAVKCGVKLLKFRESDVERFIEHNLIPEKSFETEDLNSYIERRRPSLRR